MTGNLEYGCLCLGFAKTWTARQCVVPRCVSTPKHVQSACLTMHLERHINLGKPGHLHCVHQ